MSVRISETESMESPFRPYQFGPNGVISTAKYRRTTVYPSIVSRNDGVRVHIFEWDSPSPTGKYPPGSVTIIMCEGRGPTYRKIEERFSPPGADLASAIAAAKEMLAG